MGRTVIVMRARMKALTRVVSGNRECIYFSAKVAQVNSMKKNIKKSVFAGNEPPPPGMEGSNPDTYLPSASNPSAKEGKLQVSSVILQLGAKTFILFSCI